MSMSTPQVFEQSLFLFFIKFREKRALYCFAPTNPKAKPQKKPGVLFLHKKLACTTGSGRSGANHLRNPPKFYVCCINHLLLLLTA